MKTPDSRQEAVALFCSFENNDKILRNKYQNIYSNILFYKKYICNYATTTTESRQKVIFSLYSFLNNRKIKSNKLLTNNSKTLKINGQIYFSRKTSPQVCLPVVMSFLHVYVINPFNDIHRTPTSIISIT